MSSFALKHLTSFGNPAFLALALLMLLTRYHHFGDALHLPDASWAIFFLAGFYLAKWRFFFAFSLLSASIDVIAINTGTSSYCVTSAYVFLFPAYAVLWLAGKHASRMTLPGQLVSCTLATCVTYGITSYSFYFFSGYFEEMGLAEYAQRTYHYLGRYLVITLGYSGIGLIGFQLLKNFNAVFAKAQEKT